MTICFAAMISASIEFVKAIGKGYSGSKVVSSVHEQFHH
jgi:hypothetical protein